MKDLIDREEAIAAVVFGITDAKAFDKETGEVKELFKQGNKELRKAVNRIKEIQSINAFPVVQCKDCKYWPYATNLYSEEKLYYESYRWCFYIGAKGGERFCSEGERRPDAN